MLKDSQGMFISIGDRVKLLTWSHKPSLFYDETHALVLDITRNGKRVLLGHLTNKEAMPTNREPDHVIIDNEDD